MAIYNLVVVGGGMGGLGAANRAAAMGAKVALIEGGTRGHLNQRGVYPHQDPGRVCEGHPHGEARRGVWVPRVRIGDQLAAH